MTTGTDHGPRPGEDAGVPESQAAPRIVRDSGLEDVGDLLAKLDLRASRDVVIVSGGAADLDPTIARPLRRLLARGVARAAAQVGALVIDGGTRFGVMESMGQAIADLGHRTPLLGIAPAALAGDASGQAPIDPNHSHMLLTPGDRWGDELETMLAAATTVAKGKAVVVVVAGGGPHARAEVREAVRRGWPIILIAGTGGFADRIVEVTKQDSAESDDPILADIVRDGELSVVPLDGSPDEVAAYLHDATQPDATLRSAWESFALLDLNANRHQASFRRAQFFVLTLGVVGALLAVTKSAVTLPAAVDASLASLVLLIPIVVSVAIAMANRFRPGDKWLLMRAAAEAIKREIFCYRMRAGAYRHAGRRAELAQKVADITGRLSRTEVNLAALRPHVGPIPPSMHAATGTDGGFGLLTPERYVTIRIGDQLRYYRSIMVRLQRTMVGGEAGILVLGGLGTLLAAIGHSVWVAVTIAAVGAITTFLGYRQIEASLRNYNQAATDLESIARWWNALDSAGKADPANVERLVEHAEKVLEAELGGWRQRMHDALANLRAAHDAHGRARSGDGS